MSNRYAIPEGIRVYAIGDIHGYPKALERMHRKIAYDMAEAQDLGMTVHIVYLGDYIDRGPASDVVLDCLIEQKNRDDGVYRTFLLGNHEHYMIRFMNDPDYQKHIDWLGWGGLETIRSYGYDFATYPPVPDEIEQAREYMNTHVPEDHWGFLLNSPIALEIGDYFFAHAGVNPKKPLDQQEIWDLTGIRQPFISWHKDSEFRPLPKMIVHGHTVSKEPVIMPHRIGVDTGLYQGGALTAVALEGETIRFLQVEGN